MTNLQLIENILDKHLWDENEKIWFQQKLAQIEQDLSPKNFYLTFTSIPKFINKENITFELSDLEVLEKVYPAFSKSIWTSDQLCRLFLILKLDPAKNKVILENLFSAADINELIVLYKGLYFLENANDFTLRAAEGIRTNMTSVFNAIVLNNPFPAKYFTEDAWNQMVLKAIFMQQPLYQIYGLEARRNSNLAKIARDFAHERWAAGREVSPELWRLTIGFIDENIFADLQKVLKKDTPLAKESAIKVLEESAYEPGNDWLRNKQFELPKKSWAEIGKRILTENT